MNSEIVSSLPARNIVVVDYLLELEWKLPEHSSAALSKHIQPLLHFAAEDIKHVNEFFHSHTAP